MYTICTIYIKGINKPNRGAPLTTRSGASTLIVLLGPTLLSLPSKRGLHLWELKLGTSLRAIKTDLGHSNSSQRLFRTTIWFIA